MMNSELRQRRGARTALILIGLMFALGAAALLAGCGVAPGSDPVIVTGEKTIQAAFTAVDTFLAADDANRELMTQELPDVHALAERLRKEFPPIHREAVALDLLYRKTRSADDAAAAQAKQQLLNKLASEAAAALLKIQTRKAHSWLRHSLPLSPPLPLFSTASAR